MTSPPLSEGPSPEAVAREVLTVSDEAARAAVLPMEGVEMEFRAAVEMASANVALRIAPILNEWRARLVSEAKRSAHLEDARAGCPHCAGGHDPVFLGIYGWQHEIDQAMCLRPEVWDALSLSTPKGTK